MGLHSYPDMNNNPAAGYGLSNKKLMWKTPTLDTLLNDVTEEINYTAEDVCIFEPEPDDDFDFHKNTKQLKTIDKYIGIVTLDCICKNDINRMCTCKASFEGVSLMQDFVFSA